MDAKLTVEPVALGDNGLAAVAIPIFEEGETTIGSFTLFVDLRSDSSQSRLSSLNAMVKELGRRAPQQQPKVRRVANQSERQLNALVNAARFQDMRGLCFALVNSYCEKLGCCKAVIGLVEDKYVEVYAISGLDAVVKNSPAIIDIQQAQEECLDQAERIVVQQGDTSENRFLIHQRLHASMAGHAIVSIPIQADENTVAIFTLERDSHSPFLPDELEQIEKTVGAFGHAIQLMKKSTRTLRSHLTDKFRSGLLGPLKNKLAAALVFGAMAFVAFGWLPYRPTIKCTIQPTIKNHLLAPYDAVIASAPLFAGDEIKEGDPVVQFDTRSLELERDSVLSTIKSKQIERNQMIVNRDKTSASMISAEIESLNVQLAIAERKIEQGVLRAQFDGQVISGDLRHQIGQSVPQGTPLMQIAPRGGMTIQLQIPESKASFIQAGFEGCFSTGTRPSDRHRFRVTKITPATEIVDGKNVVIAEAEVFGDSSWMKPGMSGYASINAGWQPVWWLWGHRVIDPLRLGFWL